MAYQAIGGSSTSQRRRPRPSTRRKQYGQLGGISTHLQNIRNRQTRPSDRGRQDITPRHGSKGADAINYTPHPPSRFTQPSQLELFTGEALQQMAPHQTPHPTGPRFTPGRPAPRPKKAIGPSGRDASKSIKGKFPGGETRISKPAPKSKKAIGPSGRDASKSIQGGYPGGMVRKYKPAPSTGPSAPTRDRDATKSIQGGYPGGMVRKYKESTMRQQGPSLLDRAKRYLGFGQEESLESKERALGPTTIRPYGGKGPKARDTGHQDIAHSRGGYGPSPRSDSAHLRGPGKPRPRPKPPKKGGGRVTTISPTRTETPIKRRRTKKKSGKAWEPNYTKKSNVPVNVYGRPTKGEGTPPQKDGGTKIKKETPQKKGNWWKDKSVPGWGLAAGIGGGLLAGGLIGAAMKDDGDEYNYTHHGNRYTYYY